MIDAVRKYARREPARVSALVVSAVLALASALGVVVDEQSVGEIVALVVVVLGGGEATRQKVRPAYPRSERMRRENRRRLRGRR